MILPAYEAAEIVRSSPAGQRPTDRRERAFEAAAWMPRPLPRRACAEAANERTGRRAEAMRS
jgi:hypothetical protein